MNTGLQVQRRRLLQAAVGIALGPLAHAQAYPDRPIKLLLPTSPGAAVDAVARKIAVPLATALGRPIVVENKPGSGGLIATQQLVRSPADGYTLGLVSSTHCINPHLYKMPFDALRDVQAISILSSGPLVLVAGPSMPVEDFRQFAALAKSRATGRVAAMGNAGNGTTNQLAAALYNLSTGGQFLQVPYKGVNAYITDLLGGQIDAGFLPVIAALPLIRSGQLKAMGLSVASRLSILPGVPTLAECGLAGFDVDGWLALIAPAGVPRPIVERLNTEVVRILKTPDLEKYVLDNGGAVIAGTVKEAEAHFEREFAAAGRIIKQAGIKAE